MLAAFISASSFVAPTALDLITFDGAPRSTFKFVELNDPVMGGQSHGTWSLGSAYGVMDGEVKDVPSLQAPGFIKAAADGSFADISAAFGGDLVIEARSTTPNYKGFRVTFAAGTLSPAYSCAGGGSIPFSRGCFKAKFSVPAGDAWSMIRIPFNDFSDKWSPATGEQTVTCAASEDVCPTAKVLSSIIRIELWAEGADGKVHLEVKSIRAALKSADALLLHSVARFNTSPPKRFMSCSGPLQHGLRFGISGRTEPTVPVPVEANETLADAVCCDTRAKPFAEPQFLFAAPDIALFSKLDTGMTTFYDSVCGLPLFRAPLNRTLADFKADTEEHGWPSFRRAEVVTGNVVTDIKSGFVTSKCGTHLGSYLPDKQGPRWCMDLSCISGVAAS
mmetsp:Transcript_36551/g.60544  ORF Transcript_36551/g.60544 Transcript_36551/m.60544 type:complete len:391 (+) Transcript_36551:49-1221(+)